MRHVLELGRVGPSAGLDADSVPHEFVGTFSLAADEVDGAVLHVGGVATSYDVLLNRVVVASGTSMFVRHRLLVEDNVRAGENDVTVRVHPLADLLDTTPQRPRQRWRTRLTEDARIRWVRTSMLGRAAGFAPGTPIVGPWRPMVLETGVGPRVTDLRLKASVEPDGTGLLDVDLTMTGADGLLVSVTVDDDPRALTLVDGRATVQVRIADVRRWWPHTHGTPALYDVRVLVDEVALPLPGDGTLEADVRRVGFRTLGNGSATGRADLVEESLRLWLNGVPVFARGAVWTPGDLAALDEAVALGLNLVRVNGVMVYESDAFHARCDELGLMVWQDLMFATFDYPLDDDRFREQVLVEALAETTRLVGHPSTVVVCGSAENQQQAAYFGLSVYSGAPGQLIGSLESCVSVAGVDAIFVPSSPTGGAPPTRVDVGVGQYFGVGAYLRDLPDVRNARVRFAGECLAFSNLPDDPALGGEGVPRDIGEPWDFADVREHYLRRRYGPEASTDDARRVTGELMAEVFGEWRRPDSGCGGGIVLWLRDLDPGAGWGLLDHTGAPKQAARQLAPVLQPLAIWIVDEGSSGLDVHVANDRPEPVLGRLRVELLRADGSLIEAGDEAPIAVAEHGHGCWGAELLLGRFADVSYAFRFGPAPHAAVRAVLTREGGEISAVWRVPRVAP